MTGGEKLYLLLVIVSMATFGAVLAYYSRQHGRRGKAAPAAAAAPQSLGQQTHAA